MLKRDKFRESNFWGFWKNNLNTLIHHSGKYGCTSKYQICKTRSLHLYMHICIHIYIHIYIYIYVYMYIYIRCTDLRWAGDGSPHLLHVFLEVCMYTYVYICMCIYAYTCIYKYIYKYVYFEGHSFQICIHIYVYEHIDIWMLI